jgi:hypothetical protein
VSEADDVLLGRADLDQAFTALGERLARRGVVADVGEVFTFRAGLGRRGLAGGLPTG